MLKSKVVNGWKIVHLVSAVYLSLHFDEGRAFISTGKTSKKLLFFFPLKGKDSSLLKR